MILKKSDYNSDQLWELIISQILEGDYTNHDLFLELLFDDDVPKNFSKMELQASSNPNAKYLSALCTPDPDIRLTLLVEAIELGNTKAMVMYATMLLEDSNTEVSKADQLDGFKLLEQAIELEDADAMFMKAIININTANNKYKNNKPQFDMLLSEALILLEKAIQLGNPQAMLRAAEIYSQTKWGIFNLAKAISVYEKAKRCGKSDPVIEKKLSSIDSKKIAEELMELLWDDLITGQSFSSLTIGILSAYCKGKVLTRLQETPQGTSLRYLKDLRNNPTHPLCLILNDGKTEVMSPEFKSLMLHASSVANTREGFFQLFRSPLLKVKPEEVEAHLLSFVHPGSQIDRLMFLKDKTASEISSETISNSVVSLQN
ncbi:tetratricopeptide repeat protein [Legionella cherrii]|uniref:Ankyrin repeat protein n=1 Tax=Legionella cherrii TaxID=28084 RepID=A0ABY6T675_9GAMM|nr:sel1 repeat family protein [Legionella cherrii]VEB35557.1 Uncharacterised protein [Legionella cherrii]